MSVLPEATLWTAFLVAWLRLLLVAGDGSDVGLARLSTRRLAQPGRASAWTHERREQDGLPSIHIQDR